MVEPQATTGGWVILRLPTCTPITKVAGAVGKTLGNEGKRQSSDEGTAGADGGVRHKTELMVSFVTLINAMATLPVDDSKLATAADQPLLAMSPRTSPGGFS